MLPMGVTSSSNLFNLLTDGGVRWQEGDVLKNMDDLLLSAETLEEVELEMDKLMKFCQEKNLKLNPEKFVVSNEVEFGGSLISHQTIKEEEIIFIDPKDRRIRAFSEMKKPRSKREVQVYCSMLASLQAWFPSIPLTIPNLRAAMAGNKQFVWNRILEEEYERVKKDIVYTSSFISVL